MKMYLEEKENEVLSYFVFLKRDTEVFDYHTTASSTCP
jgi:hypothetical protein